MEFETPAPPPKKAIQLQCQGSGLLGTLDRLGFDVPTALKAAAEKGHPLGAEGFLVDVHDLDERLTREFGSVDSDVSSVQKTNGTHPTA
jgi:hypothetical protein